MKPVLNMGDTLRVLRGHGACLSATRVLDKLCPERRDADGNAVELDEVRQVLGALVEAGLVREHTKPGGLVVYRAVAG